VSRDELLGAWLAAEREAAQAELEIAELGQLGADPAVAERFKRAAELRAEADRLLRLLPKHRN
jgi:hypothetical protein